jgi:putative DNA primase/helicase
MPGTTRRASVNDPSTFKPFDVAVAAKSYDGIGIRVCGKIVGIDIDDCIVDGKLLPWAQAIVERFKPTYIEISPSGTGIRIFCLLSDGFTYDTQTYYIKHGDIEVYIPGYTNRFLTVTGNALTDADVVEMEEALIWLLETYMRRPTPPTPTIAIPGESYLSDEEVIIKAASAKNGEKFTRLWNGDITGHKTHSEADAALLAILAFWCGGDYEQMDELFRQSGLMREKWDEYRGADTYGNISIRKAVNNMTDYYKPIIPRSAAEDFSVDRLKELDPMDSSKYP